MRIVKGWARGGKRYLGKVLADGVPSRSRTRTFHGTERGPVYKMTLSHEDGSTLEVQMSARELLDLILTAPAIAAANACTDYASWLEETKEIISFQGSGRPVE